MIRVFLLDRRNGTTRWGDGGLLVSLPPNSEDYVIWVDAQNPTQEEEQLLLARWFPVHDLTMEDISRPRRLPVHHHQSCSVVPLGRTRPSRCLPAFHSAQPPCAHNGSLLRFAGN